MKKIIDGKVYDSDKAREVGVWANNFKGCDYVKVALYRKRTGEYFLMKTTGETKEDLGFREDIVPVSFDEAKMWSNDHLDRKSFEKEFVNKKDGESVSVTLSLPKWVYNEVKNNATVRGTSMASEITRMVDRLYRVSLDSILCDISFESEWKVVDGDGNPLFTSNTNGNERQVASHKLIARKIEVVDGVIVITAAKIK